MPLQGLKSYGTYYTVSTTNGITAYKISEGLWNVFGISDNYIKVDFQGDFNLKTYIRSAK